MSVIIIAKPLPYIQTLFLNLGIHSLALRQYNEVRIQTLINSCHGYRAKNDALDILEHYGNYESKELIESARAQVKNKFFNEVIASL